MREKKKNALHIGKHARAVGEAITLPEFAKAWGRLRKTGSWHAAEESDSDGDVPCITGPATVNMVQKTTTEPATELYSTMLVNKKSVGFQLDCGASCNVIPVSLTLETCSRVLVMYNKSTFTPCGKCTLTVTNPCNRKSYRVEWIVVDKDIHRPILGSKAIQAMELITVQHRNILAVRTSGAWSEEQIKQEYADVFHGDGVLPGKLKLEADKRVEPVQLPKRRVPLALYNPLNEELASLQHRGIR